MLEGFLRLLRYIRIKYKVSLIRLLVWWKGGWPKPSPDTILQIPSRDPGRTILAHVYHAHAAPPKGPTAVLLNFHGSGFVFPFHGQDEAYCRKVSHQADHTVLDIKYRLAPEHPFPAASNDAEDVVKYVLSHPADYDQKHISIGGFSAGANLSLLQAMVNFPKNTFRSLICFYPPCDLAIDPKERFKTLPDPNGRPIPVAMEKTFNSAYMPAGSVNPADPRVSPAYADVTNVPRKVLMISCARDTLCVEAETLAARMADADEKRNVVARRMDKCDHGWDKRAKTDQEIEARTLAYGLAVDMLKIEYER